MKFEKPTGNKMKESFGNSSKIKTIRKITSRTILGINGTYDLPFPVEVDMSSDEIADILSQIIIALGDYIKKEQIKGEI